MIKFNLLQWIDGEKKVHEEDIPEDSLDAIFDGYDNLFHNLGFSVVVSIDGSLPFLKVYDNDVLKTTLFLEKK